ncbi:hypothetical protein [Streptomyces longwoodensis]|uniref:hypothetical protein n=1 Tax=Streptomyces longwoodensis TaxID=68231 RepID=UPI002251900B|nr:hypothetical protein [Streptomyces longwoodensis]MCX4994272.1 hypothetical protein [Streptomyces longwoodensis]
MSEAIDMSLPSWRLYNRLLLLGVSVDEASDLMNGYAHELAERIRNAPNPDSPDDFGGFVDQGADWAADLIDPKVP